LNGKKKISRYCPFKEELSTDFLAQFMDKQGPKKFSRRAFAALPEPEKEKLRAAIGDFHDRMLDVFQKVPARLMLVMRNLNTIRAVIKVRNVDPFFHALKIVYFLGPLPS
jgi:hypothetical protein